jgi:hypothetical protein
MASAKVENYSAEVTKELVDRYVAGETVETLATAYGKSVKSMVAKLVREKVYKAKDVAKAKRVTKAELVKRVETALGVTGLETLEKASHEALEVLSAKVEAVEDTLAALNAAVDAVEMDV